MITRGRARRRSIGVFVVSLAAMLAVGSSTAGAVGAAAAGPVSTTPATFTPYLDPNVPSQNIHELVQCGSTMYAVGTIRSVKQGSTTYTRNNAFSFSATNGAMTGWNPNVNGKVNAITFSPSCATAYLGGKFTTVHGTAVKNIAEVDTSTGAVISTFAHNAAGQVLTLQYLKGQVVAGGQFTTINGQSRSKLASLDPTSGHPTSYINLAFAGQYPNSNVPTKVYNSQVSNTGSRLLIEGVFTTVAGQSRQQVAILDLGAISVTLDNWHATEFNGSCSSGSEAFYAKAAAWSPDDSTIYVATTGFKPPGTSSSAPRTGLCDSVSAFSSSATAVTHQWINYTGCDSLYSVAADTSTVYIAGHERYANNPNGCDFAGPGSVSRPGVGAVSPTTGLATAWNPTRSRGHGAEDLLVTAAGLWIASDNGNDGSAQKCATVGKHGGICFLPY